MILESAKLVYLLDCRKSKILTLIGIICLGNVHSVLDLEFSTLYVFPFIPHTTFRAGILIPISQMKNWGSENSQNNLAHKWQSWHSNSCLFRSNVGKYILFSYVDLAWNRISKDIYFQLMHLFLCILLSLSLCFPLYFSSSFFSFVVF